MNVEGYLQRCAELGIDRGELATGFKAIESIGLSHEPQLLNPQSSTKPTTPHAMLFDCSESKAREHSERVKRLWASLTPEERHQVNQRV